MTSSILLRYAASLLTIVGMATPSSVARAGELRKASDAVHSSRPTASPPAASPEKSNRHRRTDADEGDSDRGSLGLLLFEAIVLTPFYVPHALVEANGGPLGGWSFAPSPYAEGTSGYLRPVAGPFAAEDDANVAPEERRPVAVQLAVDAMPPVAAEYARFQAGARLLTTFRLEVDASYGVYRERVDAGRFDSAWLGRAHVAYRFAQNEHVQFRAGLGMRHWVDPRGWALGVDALYGVDVFWGRPVTTSLEVTAGALGNRAWAFEPRGTVGFVFGLAEVFAGYDAVWVGGGGGNAPTAFLGGPVVGTRVYF
jgi:hypothetical protein